jgi:pyruvate dehydrogenase E2 component (dihydrolipoamide acetyltransferase)
VKVREADRKSVSEIAEEVARRAERMRAGEDADFGKTKRMTDATPRPVLRAALKLGDWLTVDRNLDLKRVGLPRQAFGSAMVSSVASFGVQRAFTPLSPYYRVPLVVLISEVTQKAVVVDGEVVARPMLTLSATLDHRYLDGSDAGRLARAVRAFLENPGAQVS